MNSKIGKYIILFNFVLDDLKNNNKKKIRNVGNNFDIVKYINEQLDILNYDVIENNNMVPFAFENLNEYINNDSTENVSNIENQNELTERVQKSQV